MTKETLLQATELEKLIKEKQTMVEKLQKHIDAKDSVYIGKGGGETIIGEFCSCKVLEMLKTECETHLKELQDQFELL